LSDRVSYALAVALLLLAAVLRLVHLPDLPPGLSDAEIDNLRIAETVRGGTIETYYNLRGEGREALYQILLVASTTLTGAGMVGYRVVSVSVGMVTLAAVYVLGKRLFGPLAGLASMGLLAVSFYPILLARVVLPEILLPLLTAATLLALAQSLSVYREGAARRPNLIAFAFLGVLLGLGFYAHPAHFGIVLSAMLIIAYLVLTRHSFSRGALGFTSFGILIMIIIAMPYLIASLRQPELSGAVRVFAGTGPAPIDSLARGISGILFAGDANPLRNLPGRPLFDLISGVLIVLGLATALRYWRQPRFGLLLIAMLILLPLAFIAPDSPDFSSFAVLLPLLALLFGAGVGALRASLSRGGRRIFSLILLALLIFNIQWVWRDMFEVWRGLPAMQTAYHSRLGQLALYLDRTSQALPSVICTPELYPPDDAVDLILAQKLVLMMHRPETPLRYAECGSALVLVNGGEMQQIIFLEDEGLVRMNPYLRGWVDQGDVISRADLPPNAVIRFDVSRSLADQIGRFTTAATASYAPETGETDQIAETPVRFGGNVAFLGYDPVETARFSPGAVVPVYTYWRVDGRVPADLRFFTHLLSDPQVIAVQADGLGVRADLIQPRDVIIQATLLQLPFTIPDGIYTLSIGAYEANPRTRLPVFDGDQPRGDRLFIGTIEILR
jgi:hypothetical protein